MADLATDDPRRAIDNAIDRIRMTIRHSSSAATPGEARAFLETIAAAVDADLETIRRALELEDAKRAQLALEVRHRIEEASRRRGDCG